MATYTEGSRYTLSMDYYTVRSLNCTYIADGFAYFFDPQNKANYKKNLKTLKLYFFNAYYQSWDTIEDSLKLVSEIDYPLHVFSAMNDFKGD